MVTSLPSLSLSLSVSLSLSLSLSLSHRKYLTHNIGSASALPIIPTKWRTGSSRRCVGGSRHMVDWSAKLDERRCWSHYRSRRKSPQWTVFTLGENMAAACPRWYNAALTHTKWMGNPSSPTLSSNCENRRAFFCQTSPGMHVWGVLVPIRTVFKRSNRPRE